MKTALVIMAAGMGSRFGGGIKQLEPVGPNGEIIMDYSIHDAIEAGFNKVVFIIRKDIKEAFHNAIGKRIEGICNGLNVEFAYAYQELMIFRKESKNLWTEANHGEQDRQFWYAKISSKSHLLLSMQMIIMEKKHL